MPVRHFDIYKMSVTIVITFDSVKYNAIGTGRNSSSGFQSYIYATMAVHLPVYWVYTVTVRRSNRPGEPGGSGERVDIAAIPGDMSKPYVLAGGLSADNVYAAVRAASPWGVDVASGIELEPGIKDGALMRRFVEEVRRADCIELGENGDIGECDACGR